MNRTSKPCSPQKWFPLMKAVAAFSVANTTSFLQYKRGLMWEDGSPHQRGDRQRHHRWRQELLDSEEFVVEAAGEGGCMRISRDADDTEGLCGILVAHTYPVCTRKCAQIQSVATPSLLLVYNLFLQYTETSLITSRKENVFLSTFINYSRQRT